MTTSLMIIKIKIPNKRTKKKARQIKIRCKRRNQKIANKISIYPKNLKAYLI